MIIRIHLLTQYSYVQIKSQDLVGIKIYFFPVNYWFLICVVFLTVKFRRWNIGSRFTPIVELCKCNHTIWILVRISYFRFHVICHFFFFHSTFVKRYLHLKIGLLWTKQPKIVDADVNHVWKTKGYIIIWVREKGCKCKLIIKAASKWGLVMNLEVVYMYNAMVRTSSKKKSMWYFFIALLDQIQYIGFVLYQKNMIFFFSLIEYMICVERIMTWTLNM